MSPESDTGRSEVIVGFDGSQDSRKALAWAASECELRKSRLVVLHADRWSPTVLELPAFQDEDAVEEAVLEEGVSLARAAKPAVEVVGRRASPPAGESLVAAADGATLLVVGSRGLGHLHQVLLGSVSRHCVEHARCPVVVVRGPNRDHR